MLLAGAEGDQEGMNQDAFTAITCADTSKRYTPQDKEALLPEFRRASKIFGESQAQSVLACTDWPVTDETGGLDVSAKNVPPILLVGTTGDPATPYEWTHAMAEALGAQVGIEITNQGEGHGAFGHSACVNATVNAYFLSDTIPASGTTCPPDHDANAMPPAGISHEIPGSGGYGTGGSGEHCPGVIADQGPSSSGS
jgi:hypothetical protein